MPMVSFSAEPALADAAFDAEATQLLGLAFEAAWQAVKSSGNGLADEAQAASIRECLARRVIEMGRRGERNHDRLVEEALLHLASSRAAPDIAILSNAQLAASPPQST
jgi:hypothetical protein